MLVIGSTAMRNLIPGRAPRDLDLICTSYEMIDYLGDNTSLQHVAGAHWAASDLKGHDHVEFELIDKLPSAAAYYDYEKARGSLLKLASPETLYSLKRSHRFLPRHWEKHIRDYHALKPFVKDTDHLPEITKMRMKEYESHHTPNLNRSADEFFNDDVSNHVFVHDEMHEIMAHRARPMYEYIQIAPPLVKCSKEKFNALPKIDRMRSVLEEAYVIALERGIIPMLYEGKKLATSESALQWSLMRICTTLTGGWFRDFAVENYPAIWDTRNRDYVLKFLDAVDSGKIKRINE